MRPAHNGGFPSKQTGPQQGTPSEHVSRWSVNRSEPGTRPIPPGLADQFCPGLPPLALDRCPVSQADHGGVELLDCGRIKVMACVVEVLVGLDQVRKGCVDDDRVRRIVGFASCNDPLGLVEQALALIGHPNRRPFGRSHYMPVYALGDLECYPGVNGRGNGDK